MTANTTAPTVDQLSLELSAELAANDRPYVDPRTVACRFSLLKTMALSAAHYEHGCQQPQDESLISRFATAAGPGTKKPDALRFGAAVHYMLLGEPHKVGVFLGERRAGKVWEQFQEEAVALGRDVIVNTAEHLKATAIASAVRRHPGAFALLFDGTTIEQRIDWTWMGRAMRSTPDARRRDHHLADLKTTVSAQPAQFARHSLRLYYHVQAALYGTALEAAEQWSPADCYVIAVEKTEPHPVTVLRFTDEALTFGRKQARLWMEMVLACEASGEYPGYAESVVPLDVPRLDDEPFEIEIDGKLVEVA